MIGVGLECCTAIHLPEETIAPDIYLRPPDSAESYPCRDRNGVVHPVRTRRHWRLNRDFPQFVAPLAAKGLRASGDLRGCPYSVVALRDLLREVFTALIDNPRATLRRSEAAEAQAAAFQRLLDKCNLRSSPRAPA